MARCFEADRDRHRLGAHPAIAFFRGSRLPGEPRLACGLRHSTSSTGIFASELRFSSRPSWYLCLPPWVQFQCGTGPVATRLFPQSYDRCHRRVPLVHPWRAEPALSSRFWIVAVTAFLLGFGIRRFRKMEKSFADII